jgi:hypothetical protein
MNSSSMFSPTRKRRKRQWDKRAGWGRRRVFRGRWLWMTDSLRWMKVIDDRIWMKRDILDAASMQRRGRQGKEAGALLAKIHFFTALFPPIPGGE